MIGISKCGGKRERIFGGRRDNIFFAVIFSHKRPGYISEAIWITFYVCVKIPNGKLSLRGRKQ